MQNHLMVIDDDPLFHKRLQHKLRNNGRFQQVSHCLSAKVVLDMLIAKRDQAEFLPDVIFLDLNMPEMDGRTFLQFLDHIYNRLAKPIIVHIISASALLVDRSYCTAYPFVQGFFQKGQATMEEWLSS